MAVIKANTPKGPCLATVLDDSGELCPIIPGMALFIVEDPNDIHKAIPFILVSVRKNCITLRLKTTDGGFTDYDYVLKQKHLRNQAAVNTFRKKAN